MKLMCIGRANLKYWETTYPECSMFDDGAKLCALPLTLDDDILAAAKALAYRQHKTIGEIISALARQALRPQEAGGSTRNGIPLLPVRPDAAPVTLDLVNQLRDELP